jgi:hypothetical protein
MTRKKTNKYLVIASFSTFVYLGVGHFVQLPDFLVGFCVGISIVFYLIGGYAINHDISKLQNFKKKLIQR